VSGAMYTRCGVPTSWPGWSGDAVKLMRYSGQKEFYIAAGMGRFRSVFGDKPAGLHEGVAESIQLDVVVRQQHDEPESGKVVEADFLVGIRPAAAPALDASDGHFFAILVHQNAFDRAVGPGPGRNAIVGA
jgi:hypothetical protein